MRKFAKDSLTTLITRILIFLISFIVSIIIARVLGPERKGLYALFLLIPGLFYNLFNCGIASSLIYNIGNDKEKKKTIISSINFLNLILSIITIIIAIISYMLFKNSFFRNLSIHYFYLGLILIPLMYINAAGQSLLRLEQKFYKINSILLINNVIILILVLGIFYFNSIFYVVLVNILSQSILLVIYIKLFPYLKFNMKPQSKYIKKILSYGIKVNLTNIITFFHYKIDIILINYFLIISAVGYYSLAVNLAEKIWFISISISYVLFSKIVLTKENENRKKVTNMSARIVFNLSMFAGVILYFISYPLLTTLYSNAYIQSVMPFKILLIGIIFLGLSRILSVDIAARGFPQYTLYIKLFSLITNIILNIILIPKYGINGAAIATSITYTMSTILVIIVYSKITKTNVMDLFIMKKRDFIFIKGELK